MNIQNYIDELKLWNKTHNLIAKNEINNLEIHIADSLSLTKYIDQFNHKEIIDIGSGGGFPLIPLGFWIKENNIDISLYGTDVVEKKVSFLRLCALKFELNIEIIKINPLILFEKESLIISRAFSSVKNILLWRDRHAPASKDFLLLKGKNVIEELEEADISDNQYELFKNERGYITKLHHERSC